MPQPNPTATDDALAALMQTVYATYGRGFEHEAAVRTAALDYGRAVAIAELEAIGCEYHTPCEDSEIIGAGCPRCARLAKLRAADSTGGDG